MEDAGSERRRRKQARPTRLDRMERADGDDRPKPKEPVACSWCGRAFASQHALWGHSGRCPRRPSAFPCPECNAPCGSQAALTEHKRRVHESRRVQCPDCGKLLCHKGYLAKHRLVHKEEKPFKCLDCGHEARFASNLEDHRRSVHAPQERPHVCPHCLQAFTITPHLQRHVRTHHPDAQ